MLEILSDLFVIVIILAIGFSYFLNKTGFYERRLERKRKRIERHNARRQWRLRHRGTALPLAIILQFCGLMSCTTSAVKGESVIIPIVCMVIGFILMMF